MASLHPSHPRPGQVTARPQPSNYISLTMRIENGFKMKTLMESKEPHTSMLNSENPKKGHWIEANTSCV